MHVIKLNGYNATTENGEKLELGTFDSYGEEQLQIVKAPDWANLSVIATFNPPNKKPVQVAVDSVTGVIKVPKEATADLYGVGTIVFVGLADGVQRISADCEYIVRKHSNASGTEPAEPTPDLLQQVLSLSKDAQTAAKNAEQSAKNAEQSAESAAKDAADTVKPYKEEAVQAATAAALSEKNAAASAASAQRNAEQVAIDAKTAVDAKVAAAGSAEAAAGSANAAENSASAAAGSEQAAGASELKAAKSEKAAKMSEQAAVESAQAALESKTSAANSETNAAASAKKAQDVADSLPEDYTTAVNDISTLKQQVANITPDDSTIGDKPWSSKHIIDMLCPPLEESGNPVVCYPVAGYPLGVKASWEPVQEGEGEPSPENIRPIVGRDSVTVKLASGVKAWRLLTLDGTEAWTVGGKFLEDKSDWFYVSPKMPGAANEAPLKGNEICSHYPHADIANSSTVKGCAIVWGAIRVRWGDTIPDNADNWKAYLAAQYAAGTPVQIAYRLATPAIVPEDGAIYFPEQPAQSGSGEPSPTNIRPILLDSTVQEGGTNVLTLPETIYGGSVDAVTGEGAETWGVDTINKVYSSPDELDSVVRCSFTLSQKAVTARSNSAISNWLQENVSYTMDTESFYTNQMQCYFKIAKTRLSSFDAAGVNAYLSKHPLTVCYKLATPVPFTATGGAALPALDGANTVLTDADSVEVTGRADPIKRIEDLEAAVASIN